MIDYQLVIQVKWFFDMNFRSVFLSVFGEFKKNGY